MMNLWNSQQSHDRDDYICFSYFLKDGSTFHSFFFIKHDSNDAFESMKSLPWMEKPLVKVQPRPTRYRLNQDFGELGNQQTQVGLKTLGYLVIIVYAIL